MEFDPGDLPDDRALLAPLKPYEHLYTDDLPTIDFLERLVPIFELWKRAGTWEYVHPWMETVLPWETRPPTSSRCWWTCRRRCRSGGVLLWPARGNTSRSRLFMRPEEDLVGFGILPAIPPQYWAQMKPMLAGASDFSILMGQALPVGLDRVRSPTWKRTSENAGTG